MIIYIQQHQQPKNMQEEDEDLLFGQVIDDALYSNSSNAVISEDYAKADNNNPPSSPPTTSSRLTFYCVHASSLSTKTESIHRVMENLSLMVSYCLMFRNRRFLDRAISLVLVQQQQQHRSNNNNNDGGDNGEGVFSQGDIDFARHLKRQMSSLPRPRCFDCNSFFGDLIVCLHCSYCGCREEGHARNHFLSHNHLFGTASLGLLAFTSTFTFISTSTFKFTFPFTLTVTQSIHLL